MVLFTGLGDGLGPLRMVDGVRGILGLQCNAAALAVVYAALAVFVDEITGIQLIIARPVEVAVGRRHFVLAIIIVLRVTAAGSDLNVGISAIILEII